MQPVNPVQPEQPVDTTDYTTTPARDSQATVPTKHLPETGDAGSVLGLVGTALSAIGLGFASRRKKD